MASRIDSPIRVGAVNYLNSKPLIYGFDAAAGDVGDVRLSRDLPSRLADSLAAGRLDVALIPAFEYFLNRDYRIVSDACVASDGAVGSVKLYFRAKPQAVETLALDEGSRTSAALARVLLRRRFGTAPATVPLPIGCGLGDTDADAVLLIGDRAMHAPTERFVDAWDLGEEWRRDTGLPFVFACWVPRPGVETGRVGELLERCRDDGLANLDAIARDEGPPLGLRVEHAERYLRENLRYRLGARERQALTSFQAACDECGLLPTPIANR